MFEDQSFNQYKTERDEQYGYNDFETDLFNMMDHVLDSDALFRHLNQIIDACAQQIRQILQERFQKTQRNELLREIFFYCCVFSLKLGLLIALRQGEDYGFVSSDDERDCDV